MGLIGTLGFLLSGSIIGVGGGTEPGPSLGTEYSAAVKRKTATPWEPSPTRYVTVLFVFTELVTGADPVTITVGTRAITFPAKLAGSGSSEITLLIPPATSVKVEYTEANAELTTYELL